ncbi:MAG: hypothetical protein ACI9OJ_003907, partial [Myxococcota bacterium]
AGVGTGVRFSLRVFMWSSRGQRRWFPDAAVQQSTMRAIEPKSYSFSHL